MATGLLKAPAAAVPASAGGREKPEGALDGVEGFIHWVDARALRVVVAVPMCSPVVECLSAPASTLRRLYILKLHRAAEFLKFG